MDLYGYVGDEAMGNEDDSDFSEPEFDAADDDGELYDGFLMTDIGEASDVSEENASRPQPRPSRPQTAGQEAQHDEYGYVTSNSGKGVTWGFTEEGMYKCANGKDVLHWFICDGDNDCGDLSDERGCAIKRPQGAANGYRCRGDDKVIPRSRVCDGRDDCDEGDDERRCSRYSD